MNIGIDLSVLQTPHRMRGIGATAIHVMDNISSNSADSNTFVLYLYEKDQDDALSILDLGKLRYEVRSIGDGRPSITFFKGKLRRLNTLISLTRELVLINRGDPRQMNLSGIDSFLQFDQTRPLPRASGIRKALILYDIIPYVMEADYMPSYKTARKKQQRRRSALKSHLLRKKYVLKNKAAANSADTLIAISEHTKQDFVKYFNIPATKIEVIHLGVDTTTQTKSTSEPKFERYIQNSWGYFPEPINLSAKPYLLFVGGADPRRKLIELVAAYHNLKAQGQDIRLVLVGDTMKGPNAIPTADAQQYIAGSSYLDDIIFLGFVTEKQKDWLYQNTLAFVFPSVYEGFGLPVLEAMNYGAQVITYDNSSIREVAGDLPHYAKDFMGIYAAALSILSTPQTPAQAKTYSENTQKHLQNFSWKHTADSIVATLSR